MRQFMLLCSMLHAASALPGTCRAGGAGYAYGFDGMDGNVLSMQWKDNELSQLTVEYWLHMLDPQQSQMAAFAYSVFDSGGRYGEGGLPYENANELVLIHAQEYTRLFRASSLQDHPHAARLDGESAWVHVALTWAADPADSPHGQSALFINGTKVANQTLCAVGACGMGLRLQPNGIVHLGQEADRAWGDFDEFQALTGVIDEVRVWHTIRTDEEIASSHRSTLVNASGLNFYWQFDESAETESVRDASGNGRSALVGRLATSKNLMTYITGTAPRAPTRPTRLPSTAPLVGDAPVVSLVLDGPNQLSLGSSDAEGDDLWTVIVRPPAHGTLSHAAGALLPGAAVVDAERRQNKRVWYTPSDFSSWTADNFTYAVSDGGEAVHATVVLHRFQLPHPTNKTLRLAEDTLAYAILAKPYLTSVSKRLANVGVRITSLPSRGTLYQACFVGAQTYSGLCDAASMGEAQPITAAGTALSNARGIVMFLPAPDAFDEQEYASFRYQFFDPENASLTSAEASVHISVTPTNDKPLGTPQSNITVSGPTVLTLRAVDNDEPTAANSSELRQFARVSTFPRIGQLYQTTDAGERGSLMDSSVQHVPFVVDWASEVLRFSSQISRCAGCNVWSGAGGTQCKQGRTGATSTCVGAACAVPFGAPLVWGDGSCADDAWHATHLLGPSEYFPTYGDSPLSWQPSGEANGREFFELAFPSEMYISAVEIFEVFNPGAVYRVSAARAYEDDNTIACCGDDFPSGGQCDGLPRCSSNTSWTTLWSGAAAPAAEESRAFSPPLCPARFKSRVLRVEMDAAAVASWNNIDAVRLSGTTQLPAGDVIPSGGASRVTYVPVEGTHGADGFEFEVSDCVAYGPPTAVELWVPPPAEAFVAPPYLVVEAIRDANASSTAAYADLAAPSAAGGASLYETLTALRDEAAAAAGGEAAEGGIVVELRGVERLGGVWVGGQRLAARGDRARLDAAAWQPSLRLEVTGLGRAELWFSAAASTVTFRVVLAVAAAVPQVRLGILLPMFSAGLVVTQVLWSPLVGVHQAIAEINNKSDGVADDLLPDTRLDFAYADSRCDLAHALQGALQLISAAGVAAIIGAGCSGGSTTAALVGEGSRVPIISPTSTSPQLSDGRGYPYFLRTVPSDAFSAIAMGDLLQALFNYTAVAMIHSTDAYGAGLAQAFGEVAAEYGLTIGLTQSFALRAPDFTSQLRALRQSGLRVGVLFCVADDGGRFLTQGYQQGVGGEGFFWLGGDTFADAQLWEGAELIAQDEALRSRVLRGFFSVFPNGQPQDSERYQRYVARRQSLRPAGGGGGVGCSQETDSLGTLLWAQDLDGNSSTPNACFEYDVRVDGFYDPFGYDAVFALAHALHDLVEVRGKTEIIGSELVDALLRRVRFDGVTGLVEFYDASDDPSRLYRGDRRLGFAYHLLNFVSSEQALVLVGTWRPCSNGTCSFSERWTSTAAPLTYSTADNRQPAQSVAVSCPYGEALTPDGRCVCDNGFEPDPTGEQCRRCNAGQDSRRPSNASGAPACDLCAAGYYRQHAHAPVSDCQSCAAFPNVRCALNATLESFELREGYWRLSGLSVEVLPCAGEPGASPCVGGSSAGERGVGYCRAGRHGPRCELCANSSQYISRGECVDCPAAHGRILLLAAPLAALAALAALVLCAAPRFAPRAYRFAQQRKIRLEAGISNLALIPKLKLAVSFFQTVGFLPAVYGLGLPDYYYNWIDFVHVFELDWMAVLFPTACLAGGFYDRLIIRALTPIVLVVCVLMFGTIYHLLHRGDSGRRWRKNVLKLLPIVLFLAFIFTPTTSFSIFSVWTCETFHVDSLREVPVTVQFLRGDLSIECDRAVPEYRRLMDVAFLFVAIWPVGVPLLFLLVLYSGRWAIQHGQSTQIEAATGFLHREYSKAYYWWEVFFLLQRLLVVGFAQWISHPSHRFLFALSVALVYLVALLAVKPYKRADVGLMAYSSQFATVLIFFVSMFIHLFGMLEAVDEAIEFDGLTSLVLAFSSLDSLVVTSIAIILAFFAAFMALTLYQMAVSNNIQLFRLTSSTQIPELSLDTNKLFHLFLSHIWSSGQDQVANIKRKLQLMLPGCQIFLDVDDLENIGDLEHYVEASQSVLIFLSKGYFFSANCLRELESALCALIPLILVHEKDVSKGGAPLDTLRAESEHHLFNDNREIIEWHRAGEFQLLALKRIAQSMLHATPLFRKMQQFPKLYLPGELSSLSLHFPGMITVYASPHNPGCRKAAEEIRFRYKDKNLLIEYVQPVELKTSKPRQSTAAAIDLIARARRSSLNMGTPFRKNRRSEPRDSSLGGRYNKFRLLLYLNQKTFVGAPGNELADEVRTARKRGVEIILVHENDEARGGCPFSRLFETTPNDLVQDGLYKKLAIEFHNEPYRAISLALLAKALGASSSQPSMAVQVAQRVGLSRASSTSTRSTFAADGRSILSFVSRRTATSNRQVTSIVSRRSCEEEVVSQTAEDVNVSRSAEEPEEPQPRSDKSVIFSEADNPLARISSYL